MCLQIFDNAYDKLEEAWQDNVYSGFGVEIHRVEHDSSKTDFYPEADYERNRDYLEKSLAKAPSDVVHEFRLIMAHFSSSLYRWQFQRCENGGKGGCPICPEPRPPQTPLERFYEKFGGEMPSPIPFWAAFPPKPRSPGVPKGPVECAAPAGPGSSGSSGLHYRAFLDLLKMNIPHRLMYADQHYDGCTARHACQVCSPEVCHRSAAALARHMRMLHS